MTSLVRLCPCPAAHALTLTRLRPTFALKVVDIAREVPKLMDQRVVRVLFVAILCVAQLAAQTNTEEGIAKYRQMLQEGNPADLWGCTGEGIVSSRNADPSRYHSKACDLGLGPGVVKGAYAAIAALFQDAKQVQSESRLITCMVIAGLHARAATKITLQPEQSSTWKPW